MNPPPTVEKLFEQVYSIPSKSKPTARVTLSGGMFYAYDATGELVMIGTRDFLESLVRWAAKFK